MGIREKITPKNLNVQQYFIRTNNRQNPYLLITGLDDVVGSGVYSFIIHGSSFLLQDSEIRFEAIDSRGNQISIAGVRNILKGNSRVVSFTIDDTIEDGEATIYVAAVLEDYLTDQGLVESVPQQFSGDENLLFTFRFDIDKEKNNNDEIIFKRPPIAVVTPKIKKVRTITKPDVSETVTEAEIVNTFYNPNRRELQVTVFDETGTKFEREMDGKEVTITNADIDLPGTKIFTAGRKNTALFRIPNPDVDEYTGNELISLLPDAIDEEENAKLSFTIDYNRLAQYNLVKLQEAAFATFDFRNLTTVSGDVEKIRIYGKSDTLQTDYNLINEYELLGQNSLVLEDIGNIGIFDNDDKLSNWNVSTVTTSSVLTPTIARDESILSAGVVINGVYNFPEKKEVNGRELQTPRYKFQSDTNLILRRDTEYFIRFKAAVLEVPEPDTRLDVYIVSDYLSGENNSIGKLIGSIRTNSNEVWEEGVEMILTNESDIIDGKIAFVNTAGRWILSDIEISSELQKGFSPAEYKVDVPVDVKKDKQDIDFRVEFLDADDNKASIGLQIDNVIFDRPNLVIEGFDNFLSGSLFVGEATSSGIGLGLSDAGGAFIKSVPYDGFIDATTGGQSGFLLYSGSVTSSVEDEYSGSLGVEIVKDFDNYLRFRTEPSLFEVKSDVFFFGNADTQFISGSNSNIEISASNFHLDPKNNLLILRGAIRQDSNGVELSDFRNRGYWEVGNIYLNNDIVQYGFNDVTQSYIAVNDHTASAVDPDGPPEPDASNNWEVFASGGTAGADGADGSDGIDSFAVNLIASDQSIEYDETGANPDPSSVTITANAINTEGTIYYEFFLNDSSEQNTTSNTYTLTPEASIDDMPQKVEVQIRSGSASSGILARDQVTVFGIQDGVDAYTVILTNEAHTLPTTNTGTVTYTGSGTSVIVYKGTTELNGITSGTPTTGQFSATVSATNITAGSQTSTGNPIVFGEASNMTADNASIEFTINAEDVASITKIQSFAKSIQGDNGVDGNDGDPGPGVVFRGRWENGESYFASTTRRDVVVYDDGGGDDYYLATSTHTATSTNAPDGASPAWEGFGATFSSVATDILFAQDVYANRTINIGSDGSTPLIALNSDFSNGGANPFISIGQGGSPGFNSNGIFLGYDGGTEKLSLVGTDSLTWNGDTLSLTGAISFTNSPNISTFTNDSGYTDDTAANAAQQAADDAQADATTALTRPKVFRQTNQPSTSEPGGSLWYDTDDDNKLYILVGTTWTATRDGQIAQAISDASTAQSTADRVSDDLQDVIDGVSLASAGTFIDATTIYSPLIAGTNGYISNIFKVGNGGITLDGPNQKIFTGTGTFNNSNTPFYVDNSSNFSLGDKLTWNGTTLNIDGSITADDGQIGGWVIDTNSLTSGDGTFTPYVGLQGNLSGNDALAIFAGAETDGGNNATFSVTNAGKLTATNAELFGTVKIYDYEFSDIFGDRLLFNSGSIINEGGDQNPNRAALMNLVGHRDNSNNPIRTGFVIHTAGIDPDPNDDVKSFIISPHKFNNNLDNTSSSWYFDKQLTFKILNGGSSAFWEVAGDFTVTGDLTVDGTINGNGGSSVNSFETIAVSGQSDVVADSSTDTLTFVAGTNMSITTNATNDTITFNSTGGGTGDITSVIAGNALTGGGVSGDVTLNVDESAINGSNIINDLGWTSNTGDITSVSAGGGLSGGGTSGAVTISHDDTSSQASSNNSGNTVIQDITLDTYGHITGIGTTTLTFTDTNNFVDGISFNTGNGILTLSRSGLGDLTVDLDGRYSTSTPNNATIGIVAGTGLSGGGDFTTNQITNENITLSVNSSQINTSDLNNDAGFTSNSGTVTQINVGTGLDVVNATTSPTITLDLSEFTSGGTLTTSDEFIVLDSGLERKVLPSNIPLSIFNNDLGISSANNATITISAGNGLTTGGDFTTNQSSNETITLNVGAGTGIDVAADAISVDVSDFMSNGSNNRILTATGADSMNAESTLTYDGSILETTSGYFVVDRNTTNFRIFFATDSNNDGINMGIGGTGNFYMAPVDGGSSEFTNELLWNQSNSRWEFETDVLADDFVLSSDRRLKSNIIPLSKNIDKVKNLTPYSYEKNGKEEIGIIAQDLEKVHPESVKEDSDGYKQISTMALQTINLGAIKELIDKVEYLENKVKELENRNGN